jgi:hypothetical protein
MARLSVLIGSIGLLAAAVLGARSFMFLMTSARAQGTVVEVIAVDSGRYFVVRYEVSGKTHEIRSHRYSGMNTGNTGMQLNHIVTVMYPPDAPRDGRIYTFTEQLGIPLGFGAPSLGFLLYGLSKSRGAAPTRGKSKKGRSRSKSGLSIEQGTSARSASPFKGSRA